MVALKSLIFVAGFILTFWIVGKLTKEFKGDEREKRIAQLAGLSTWQFMVSASGLQALLLITHVNIPFFSVVCQVRCASIRVVVLNTFRFEVCGWIIVSFMCA